MTEIRLDHDPENSWPYEWYDPDTDTIYIKRTKDWFEPKGVNHEMMHAVLFRLEGREACLTFDNIALAEGKEKR